MIRYDVRGLGKSARPQTSFSHSDDLYALLEFLKISRAHVVGLSVGGAIAIDFVLEHAEMVDHLILAAAGLSNDSKGEANMRGLVAISELVRTQGIERFIQLTLDAPFVLSKQNDAGREKVREIYLDNHDVFETGLPVFALWKETQPAAETRLESIEVPVLIVRGDNDSPIYSAMTDKISKGVKHSTTVVIPGGTHFLNLEKPEEFDRVVLNFLNK